MQPFPQAVNEQYGQPQLADRILAALERVGKNMNALTRDDLITFDEFHICGRDATRELARLAQLTEGTRVLDMGCGIGGPARTLAAEFGCDVVGLEVVAEFYQTAKVLTERVGMSDRVRFQHSDALTMPFDNHSFDVVWSQHVMMNIEDKSRLFTQLRRVLVPNGRFVLHTICAGPLAPPHFPVPWANDASLSYLVAAEELRQMLATAGFKERVWRDISIQSLEWFRSLLAHMQNRPKDAPPPLGFNLLMGEKTAEKTGNVFRNLKEDRIKVVQGVFQAQSY